MQNWVALLRGVNVGGANKVPMADLRALAAGLGWQDVRSYIASGNLMFGAKGEAEKLADALRQGMSKHMGVDVPVLVLAADDVRQTLRECPFDADKGNLVHVQWCWNTPQIDTVLLATLKTDSEELLAIGDTLWLHAPDGVARSKLFAKIAKVTGGVEMTARNLNTLRKLVEMLDDRDAD